MNAESQSVAADIPHETTTILDHYANDDEIRQVREVRDGISEAEVDVEHVLSVLRTVREQIAKAERAVSDQVRRSVALALGESCPDEPYSGPSISILQAQERELERRLAKAQEVVAERRGQFRAAVCGLLRTCMERCIEDYIDLTKKQGWCHQQLAVSQRLIGNFRPLIEPLVWNRYFVPGSEGSVALKQQCRNENFVPVLMSADRLSLTDRDAVRELRNNGEKLIGAWPL